jgi:hypothetical protein
MHIGERRASKIVNNIHRLAIIPPSKMIHHDAYLAEGGIGLLNLNLESAVGEQKWIWVVEDDSHSSESFVGRYQDVEKKKELSHLPCLPGEPKERQMRCGRFDGKHLPIHEGLSLIILLNGEYEAKQFERSKPSDGL